MTLARFGRMVRSGTAVATGSFLGNLLGYLFLVLLSREYRPADFGAANAILAVGAVAAIPATALQLVVARRVAALTASGGAARVSERLGWGVGAAIACAVIATSPAVAHLLDVPVPALVWTAAMSLSFTAASSYLGAGLGRRRMVGYGAALAVMGATRMVAGAAVGIAGLDPTRMMAVLAVTTLAGTLCVRQLCGRNGPATSKSLTLRSEIATTIAVTWSLSSFMVLSSIDLLLARGALGPEESGVYAAGSLYTRIGIWAPQFVAIMAFPVFAAAPPRGLRRLALLTTVSIGAAASAIAAAAGSAITSAVLGTDYEHAGTLAWLFTTLGVLLAVVYLDLMTDIAGGHHAITWLIWATVVCETVVVTVRQPAAVAEVLVIATLATTVLAAIATTVMLGRREPTDPSRLYPTISAASPTTSP